MGQGDLERRIRAKVRREYWRAAWSLCNMTRTHNTTCPVDGNRFFRLPPIRGGGERRVNDRESGNSYCDHTIF